MKSLRTTLFVVLLSFWHAPSTNAQNPAYLPPTGELHPQIVLTRIDTQEAVALSDYRGKKVLLIHFASW